MFMLDTAVNLCKVPDMGMGQFKAPKLERDQDNARKSLILRGSELDDALDAVTRCKDRLRSVVVAAAAVGLTEVEIARLAGISRPTVRDWLGKT
ncbi:helix-turn-helix domain-containing protein [Arthrobacter sp. 2RAF6]|uniref:helix-turn-helix domain-containing protein n=1 Tax=Arthrobacter sp. 2RAF6 TaxID=3233002 RepID=UPI003F93D05D